MAFIPDKAFAYTRRRVHTSLQLGVTAGAALVVLSLGAGRAEAYVVTVGGVQYDVTTFTGSYDGNISRFNTPANNGVMPWWENQSTATAFANAVGSNLGTPNFFNLRSPYFGTFFVEFAGIDNTHSESPYGVIQSVESPTDSFVWAQASVYAPSSSASVPGPLPLFGAGAAFGFSRRLRKRIQPPSAAMGSGLPQR